MRSPRPRPKLDPPPAPATPPALPVVQELSNLYFELLIRRSNRYQGLVAEFGLTPAQMRALVIMDPKQSMTMSELAHKSLVEPSNLTGIIDRLVARRLVKRSLAATDRRVKIVSVTRAGDTLRTKLFDRIREPAPWMLALSEDDQRQLLHILRKGLAFELEAAGSAKN